MRVRLGVPWAASILASAGWALALGALASARVFPAEDAAPDFVRDVQPILAASCVRCHGRGESKASLRLDTAAYFRIGGESGAVVAPGDPGASPLIARVTNPDPKQRMPHEADPLAPAAIETLRRWIGAGAPWPEGVTVAVAEAREATLPTRAAPSRQRDASRLRYNRDVRPILAESCFPCHGPDGNSRKAGLRLDREEVAKGTLASGTVPVVAGAPDRSGVIARVLHPDEASRMPLAKSGRARLAPDQVATLRRWIEEGAEWEPHWAYVPPAREEPPATRDRRWARNPIDAFVLAGIEAAGLRPSPEATRAELLRRLSFDITGLPPAPAEVRAYERDTRADAYERQVDRLLASAHFGERMALFWLDLVRYSDSVGYHSDNARPMWRYRDWVVEAWNRNLPFDRFTLEQLAGDLLPGAGYEQKIASGYNRLLQTTEEGGAQPKEYRAIYLADRVRNASGVWMGATLGCAQCHDHKFDPYRARDFYAFAAFFADVKEEPVGRRKPDALPDAARKPALDALDARVTELKDALDARMPTPEWEQAISARRVPRFTTLEPVLATSANGTRLMIQGNDFSIIASTAHGPKPPADVYTVRFKTELETLRALRLEAVTFDELPRGGPGRDPAGGFVVSEIEVKDAAGRPLALRNVSASTLDGAGFSAAQAIDGRTHEGGWALDAADGESHRLVVELEAPLARDGETTTLTLVVHQNAGRLRTLGRLRLSGTSEPLPVRTAPGLEPSADLVTSAGLEPAARTQEQQTALAKFYRREAPELQAERVALRAAELERQALLESVPQAYVTTAQEPDPVRVLPRGNWLDDSGEQVAPAVPQFLPPLAQGAARATRLDLARWLTAPENPLTARVLANRLWKLCFGQGLSRSVEDLGAQGEWPTHPELLDWLAVELRTDWDVKRLLRTIVTSATYRQSAALTTTLAERDPANRLYARQARFRLDAELVRDNALAVSGLLSPRLFGPSVFPYQPAGYWAYLNFPPREWDASPGEDQYRRGLYTWWQRSFPSRASAPSTRRAARSARASACARTCRSRRSCC